MYQFFSYLKFLFQSTNQHGVHSPFVFDFVTKGLYKKNFSSKVIDDYNELKGLSKKEKVILSKIINYFDIQNILIDQNESKITSNTKYNLLYFNNLKDINKIKGSINKEENIVLIKGIYKNKKTLENWKDLIYSTPNIVSINLYYFGIIFYRPQQAKEHFKIRV